MSCDQDRCIVGNRTLRGHASVWTLVRGHVDRVNCHTQLKIPCRSNVGHSYKNSDFGRQIRMKTYSACFYDVTFVHSEDGYGEITKAKQLLETFRIPREVKKNLKLNRPFLLAMMSVCIILFASAPILQSPRRRLGRETCLYNWGILMEAF